MADNFANLKEIQDYQKLLKEIKEEEAKILADRRRYNKEGNLSKKAQEQILKLIADQQVAEQEIAKLRVKSAEEQKKVGKDQISFQKELNNLAKKSNKLASSKKGRILSAFGLEAKNQKFIDKAKEASTLKEKNAFKELEQLRIDSLDELADGTFDLDIFKSKLADIDLPDDLKDALERKFSNAAGDADAIKNAMDINLPFLDKLDDLQAGAETIKGMLGNAKLLGLALAGLVLKAITDFVMQAKQARQELGITAGSAAELSVDMTAASKAAFLFGGDTEKASQSVQALTESMGRVAPLSTATAAQFGKIAGLSGASAESLATIVELNSLALGQSVDKSVSDLASLEALAESEGVLKSQVFDDVAQSAKDQALFFGKSAKEIAKAAVAMRKLGIEASALNALAESLLDLESSIASEFELQVLFGKNINLNKARQLAFDRDSAGLAREIKMQLGGQFDLASANAAQVKALTDAFGLSQEQLQKVIQGQDIFNNKVKEGNDFSFTQLGLTAALVGTIGAAIGAVIGMITLGAALPKMAAGAKGGALIGGAAGLAAGGVGFGIFSAMKSNKMEDASIERKSVGSMEPAATFSLGDAASINVSKSTQDSINLEMDKLVKVIREELVAEVKSGNKDNRETLSRVVSATEDNTRAVRKIM